MRNSISERGASWDQYSSHKTLEIENRCRCFVARQSIAKKATEEGALVVDRMHAHRNPRRPKATPLLPFSDAFASRDPKADGIKVAFCLGYNETAHGFQ